MVFDGTPEQALALLGAMADVARAGRDGALSDLDRAALGSAATLVLRLPDPVDVDALPSTPPAALATSLGHLGREALIPLVVMATVDGCVDPAAADLVRDHAEALGLDAPAVDDLEEVVHGELAQARADMLRRNRESITGEWVEDTATYGSWLMPYGEAPDPRLAERYRTLADLPEGSFGRAFSDFYARNGFSLPGEPSSPTVDFTTPHDSAHVLSGYDTSVQGELLVSTFTAGMHRDQALAGHILPVILSWHLGVPLADLAGSTTGALDARKLWVAWSRGDAVVGDTFGPDWDFWEMTTQPLAEVRRAMAVGPLDPADAAGGEDPDWYQPSA